MLFSDESKFKLFKSDGCQYALFRPGQAYDDQFVKKTIEHGGGKVMVWGCITGQGMGRLHKIEKIIQAPDYVKIIEDQFLGTLKDLKMCRTGNSGVIFQQDNDPKHTSKLARQWFRTHKVNQLSWPPSSPDMNIIEHVWDQLDRLIRAWNPLPRCAALKSSTRFALKLDIYTGLSTFERLRGERVCKGQKVEEIRVRLGNSGKHFFHCCNTIDGSLVAFTASVLNEQVVVEDWWSRRIRFKDGRKD